MKHSIIIVAAIALAGCVNLTDSRDAAWDPKPGQGSLFEQIPNWDGAAERICCGSNRSQCRPHQSPRC